MSLPSPRPPLVRQVFEHNRKRTESTPARLHIWNVNAVVRMLETMGPPDTLKVGELARRLALFLAFASSRRPHSDLGGILKNDLKLIGPCQDPTTIHIHVRTTKEGGSKSATIQRLPDSPNVCVVRNAAEYLRRAETARAEMHASGRNNNAFFITIQRPYKDISPNAMGAWIKHTLTVCDIDTKLFSAHSTRSAASTHALLAGVDIDELKRRASWSRDSSTFQRLYFRLPPQAARGPCHPSGSRVG